jgi:hypothetical protein
VSAEISGLLLDRVLLLLDVMMVHALLVAIQAVARRGHRGAYRLLLDARRHCGGAACHRDDAPAALLRVGRVLLLGGCHQWVWQGPRLGVMEGASSRQGLPQLAVLAWRAHLVGAVGLAVGLAGGLTVRHHAHPLLPGHALLFLRVSHHLLGRGRHYTTRVILVLVQQLKHTHNNVRSSQLSFIQLIIIDLKKYAKLLIIIIL